MGYSSRIHNNPNTHVCHCGYGIVCGWTSAHVWNLCHILSSSEKAINVFNKRKLPSPDFIQQGKIINLLRFRQFFQAGVFLIELQFQL